MFGSSILNALATFSGTNKLKITKSAAPSLLFPFLRVSISAYIGFNL